jgi:cell division protein FtsW (lipid II flippase)
MSLHQAGHHIGGLACLLIIALSAYAVFSWMRQHQLRMIAGAVAAGICILFGVQAMQNIAWGLLGLTFVSVAGTILAHQDMQDASWPSEREAEAQ